MRPFMLWFIATFFPTILIDAVVVPVLWDKSECVWSEGPYVIGLDVTTDAGACAVLIKKHRNGTMEAMAQKHYARPRIDVIA